jgi:hypothetical protein
MTTTCKEATNVVSHAAISSVSALGKRVPVPPSDIREEVRTCVQGLTRPVVSGIALDETLTVQWPTGLHALMAFLQPDVLVDRLMVEINRIANTPCPGDLRREESLKPTDPFQLTHLIGDAPFKLAIPGGKIYELISDCSSYEPPDSRGN